MTVPFRLRSGIIPVSEVGFYIREEHDVRLSSDGNRTGRYYAHGPLLKTPPKREAALLRLIDAIQAVGLKPYSWREWDDEKKAATGRIFRVEMTLGDWRRFVAADSKGKPEA